VESVLHKGDAMQGYCMKCRQKREMQDVKPVTMKNGRPASRGKCPECGAKMFRIGVGAPVKSPGETMKRILPIVVLVIGAIWYFFSRPVDADEQLELDFSDVDNVGGPLKGHEEGNG
jgi:hypothetical protein